MQTPSSIPRAIPPKGNHLVRPIEACNRNADSPVLPVREHKHRQGDRVRANVAEGLVLERQLGVVGGAGQVDLGRCAPELQPLDEAWAALQGNGAQALEAAQVS